MGSSLVLPAVSSGLVVLLLLAGCGEPGAADAAAGPARATTGARAPETAASPAGSTARLVTYRCRSGRDGTLAVDVPDLRDLAGRLNRIQPCEYDRGVARATVTVPCGSRSVLVHLAAADGRVSQPSDEELCP